MKVEQNKKEASALWEDTWIEDVTIDTVMNIRSKEISDLDFISIIIIEPSNYVVMWTEIYQRYLLRPAILCRSGQCC